MSRPYFSHPADIALYRAACSTAFADAGVFHRDASFGNIMIGLDGGGRLNDWDLCRDVDVDNGLEGPRTVSGLLYTIPQIFTSVCRGPGSSCRPGCSQDLSRGTR